MLISLSNSTRVQMGGMGSFSL